MDFTQELADELYGSDEQFPVDLDLAWKWLEYSRKDACERALLNPKWMFTEGEDFNSHNSVEVRNEGDRQVSRTVTKYLLSVDCFKELAMVTGTDAGKKVRRYFLNSEKRMKQLATQYQAREVEAPDGYRQFTKRDRSFLQFQGKPSTGNFRLDTVEWIRLESSKCEKEYGTDPLKANLKAQSIKILEEELRKLNEVRGFSEGANESELIAEKLSEKPLANPVEKRPYDLSRTELWAEIEARVKGLNRVIVQDLMQPILLDRFEINETSAFWKVKSILNEMGWKFLDAHYKPDGRGGRMRQSIFVKSTDQN